MDSRDNPLYQLTITNREMLQANGIMEVESFDEHQIVAVSKLGPLVIKGGGLHIVQLNLDEGEITLEGEINSIQYVEDKRAKMRQKGKGIMERLFR